MIVANKFIAEELAYKVYHLSKALRQAELIIDKLEHQNKNLMDALNDLASINNEDHVMNNEAWSEHSYAT